MIKLSITSKLDGNPSWSLQAFETCAGAVEKGVTVPACAGCYAREGNYRFANVKAVREHNKEDWKRNEWVNDMAQALAKHQYMRWFDSGDMYDVKLARKILDVMKATPDTRHWLPTRMHKFAKFKPVLDAMRALPNVSVRASSDSVTGEYIKGLHGSVITPTASDAPKGTTLCQAYQHGGKCSGCRACWDSSVQVIAYPAHGQSIRKVIRIQLAA